MVITTYSQCMKMTPAFEKYLYPKKGNLSFIFWQPVRGPPRPTFPFYRQEILLPLAGCAFPLLEQEAIIYMNGPELKWMLHCMLFPTFPLQNASPCHFSQLHAEGILSPIWPLVSRPTGWSQYPLNNNISTYDVSQNLWSSYSTTSAESNFLN